jgi:nucleoside-diphosphate-sugar epimerase
MQTHCLVTGAAGFIGSHLVDALLVRGATVTGIDNLKLGRRANLSTALKNPHFKFFEADINDLASSGKIIEERSQSIPLLNRLASGRQFRHPRGRC